MLAERSSSGNGRRVFRGGGDGEEGAPTWGGRHASCSLAGMTLDYDRARQLCSQQELALVASARTEELRSLTPKRLQAKIVRARGFRNKFRDLASRQAREARGKAPPRRTRPARGNARTVEKAELFGEVLKRFEARAAKLDHDEGPPVESPRKAPSSKPGTARRAASASAKPGTSRRTTSARPTPRSSAKPLSTKASQRRRSQAAASARQQRKIAISQAPRVQAHVSSRNRRTQARRDSR
jgi:hypothetical protein